jgi:hypothetical protein
VEILNQESAGTEDSSESNDNFGRALAASNFGNGAATDLAVGVPGEDLSANGDGVVHVFYGGVAGLDTTADTFLNQNSSLVEEISENGDAFGSALAAGNFGQSGQADLAVGVPGESVNAVLGAGAVNVLFGSPGGITVLNDQLWNQDREGVVDVAEESDGFGQSLTAANFGKTSHADLAVGVFLEGITGPADLAGAVHVLYGGPSGLTAGGDQLWHQNVSGIADKAEQIDFFGWSLASADFGKTSQADLAIGVPLESFGAFTNAGVVQVLYGTATGLKAAGSQLWHQNVAGVQGAAATGDLFGWALNAANFGKTTKSDLAIGVVNDVVTGFTAGAVNVLYGGTGGLSSTGNQIWHQDRPNIDGVAEDGDSFGQALG